MQALAKYAFGLGTVTMVLCTLVFTGMSLPPGQGLGTQILVKVSPWTFPDKISHHPNLYTAFSADRTLRQGRA